MAALLRDLRSRLEGDKRVELPPRADVSIGTPAHNNPMGPLPPEIRRPIIVAAFGHRTLHLDLALKHPPMSYPGSNAPSHANVQRLRHRNVFRPRRWEWWGCECHNAPRRTWDLPASEAYWRQQPANDRCRERGANLCCAAFGEVPSACSVGVLGWLLSCRAAYLETIDVLYGTNTFHIARTDLFLDLPKLFIRERLTAITEVELLLDRIKFSLSNNLKDERNKRNLPVLMTVLPEIFPSLRRLYLSIQCEIFPPGRPRVSRRSVVTGLHRQMADLLMLIDDGVARCRNLEECRVAMPTTRYAAWKFCVMGDYGTLGDGGDGVVSLWKELRLGDLPRIEGVVVGEGVKGYWVCHGKMDWDIENTRNAPPWYHNRPRGEEEVS